MIILEIYLRATTILLIIWLAFFIINWLPLYSKNEIINAICFLLFGAFLTMLWPITLLGIFITKVILKEYI